MEVLLAAPHRQLSTLPRLSCCTRSRCRGLSLLYVHFQVLGAPDLYCSAHCSCSALEGASLLQTCWKEHTISTVDGKNKAGRTC